MLLTLTFSKELYMSEMKRSKDQKTKLRSEAVNLHDVVSEQSLEKNYKVLGKVLKK